MATSSCAELLRRNSTAPNVRLEIGKGLLECVQRGELAADSTLLSELTDTMFQWLSGSNFKVALLALDILSCALDALTSTYTPFLLDYTTQLMERFGDAREEVRQEAEALVLKLMASPGASPQTVFEKLLPGLNHKQWLVRVGVMQVLQALLRNYGSSTLVLSKVTPGVCKLISDPASQVRTVAMDTVVEMYVHVGDRLLTDIQRKRLLPEPKVAAVLERCSEAKRAGLVNSNSSYARSYDAPDATNHRSTTPSNSGAVVNAVARNPRHATLSESSAKSRASSVPPKKGVPGPTGPAANRVNSAAPTTGGAGAVDEDSFYIAFEKVPKLTFFSGKDIQNILEEIRNTIADSSKDWDKRAECLKKIRSLLLQGAAEYDEFFNELKQLQNPFGQALKDLRSQIVREACVTLAYLSEKLTYRLDAFAEAVFPPLMAQIQSSAKVMASSAIVAARFVLKNTQAPKLIPIITGQLSSRSKEIRRACCDMVCQILLMWGTSSLERHVTPIQTSIKAGLNDADPEARAAARKAYWGFADHFKDQAESLFQSLDANKQRQLRGEMSQSSSANSLAGGSRLRASQENLRSPAAAAFISNRSTSDIDAGAARRAMQRHGGGRYGAIAGRVMRPSGLAMNNRVAGIGPPAHPSGTAQSPRSSNKSISQPGSRSSSPTGRLFGARRTPTGSSSKKPSRLNNRDPSPKRVGGQFRASLDGDGRTPRRQSGGIGNGRIGVDEPDKYYDGSVGSMPEGGTLDLSELLKSCTGGQHSERREALMGLKALFMQRTEFSKVDIRRICDALGRMFVDPHNKTFCVFLDTLVEFLHSYRTELHGWLYVLLTRLLSKLGTDLLSSLQTKLQVTVEVVRHSFPPGDQYMVIVRYTNDPAQSPSHKVKLALLNYLHDLVGDMDPCDFANTSDNRRTLTKIIEWTLDNRSQELRTAAQRVLLVLFNLNAPEFTTMLSTLGKQYQDSVHKLLGASLQRTGAHDSSASPSSLMANMRVPFHSPRVSGGSLRGGSYGGVGARHHAGGASNHPAHYAYSNGPLNMEEVRSSLMDTVTQIHSYTNGGGTSQDSGYNDYAGNQLGAYKPPEKLANGRLDLMSESTEIERQKELIDDILSELSNHNCRGPERQKAMHMLRQMTRDGTFVLWDEHFQAILLIMLETLGDSQKDIRIGALAVLKQIAEAQGPRFHKYAELTVTKLLEAHHDPEKDVVRTAEECAGSLMARLPADTSLRILNPVLSNERTDSVSLLAAIKMCTRAVESGSREEALAFMPQVVPEVLKHFAHEDSTIRKATVLGLVAFHSKVGSEELEPYLTNLMPTKRRLLDVYINRKGEDSTGGTRTATESVGSGSCLDGFRRA